MSRIFISRQRGYTDNAIAHCGVPDGGMEDIQKPLEVEWLLRKVRKVLDKYK